MANIDPITLSIANDVATISLNRPEKRNALNRAMWAGLADAANRADADAAVKIIVVRGAGGHFAAGADISEFETVYGSKDASADYAKTVASGIAALTRAAKPVIAQIEGACVGGGMAIALACDLRLAGTGAKLGITPAKLGIVYGLADTKRLVDAVGASKAKDILFTGHIMGAGEARAIGLVDEVHEDVANAVADKAAMIAANSQWSVRKSKEILRLILGGTLAETEETSRWHVEGMEMDDFREGRAAFMEKRKPDFPFR